MKLQLQFFSLFSVLLVSQPSLSQANFTASVYQFARDRVPNINELKYDAAIGALVEIGLGSLGFLNNRESSNNPTSKEIYRDLTKVIGVVPKVLEGVEVGNTGLVYDSAYIYSQVAKPLSKAALILALTQNGISEEKASVTANFLGNTLARGLVLAGQDSQKSNSTEPFHQYVWTSFDWRWGLEAAVQVVPKQFVATGISYVIKKLSIGDGISRVAFAVGNFLTGANMGANSGIFLNAQNLKHAGYNARVALPISFLTTYIAVALQQVIFTVLLATPSRIIMDSIDKIADQSSPVLIRPFPAEHIKAHSSDINKKVEL